MFDWSKHIENLPDFPSLDSSLWYREMVNEIRLYIRKDRAKAVLEVGCSNGSWLRWFAREYGSEVYGLDINRKGFVKRDVHFLKGDAFKLPYKDRSFDIVFSTGFIEHFKNDFELLQEQARVLKPQGCIICEVPNLALSLEYVYVKYFYDFRRGYQHFVKTHTSLINHLRSLGLDILVCKFLGWFWVLDRLKIPKLFNSSLSSTDYLLIAKAR